jgi:hypothetical protein
MPNDAEAGVSSVFRHGVDAARKFADRVPGDDKAPNPKGGRNRGGMTLEEHRVKTMRDLDQMIADGAPPHILEMKLGDFVHGQMDYDEWGSAALRRDGGKNGPAFLTGQDIFNEELKEIFPEKYHGVIDGYSLHRLDYDKANRQGQRGGQRNLRGEGFGDQKLYNSLFDGGPPSAPASQGNSAMADALRQAGVKTKADRSNLKAGLLPAGAAAAGSGTAKSAEPTSPEERGFQSWEDVSRDPTAPLPVPTWGDIGESVTNVLGMPMTGLQGLARGAYGLLTGEDFTEAAAQGGNTMGVGWKDGLLDMSGMNPDKGADQAEAYVTEKTGDESLGWMAKMGLLFGGL